MTNNEVRVQFDWITIPAGTVTINVVNEAPIAVDDVYTIDDGDPASTAVGTVTVTVTSGCAESSICSTGSSNEPGVGSSTASAGRPSGLSLGHSVSEMSRSSMPLNTSSTTKPSFAVRPSRRATV